MTLRMRRRPRSSSVCIPHKPPLPSLRRQSEGRHGDFPRAPRPPPHRTAVFLRGGLPDMPPSAFTGRLRRLVYGPTEAGGLEDPPAGF